MPCYKVLYIGNSTVLELRDLKNSVTDTADTGATVTVTLVDDQGAQVSGQSWPLLMPHVSAGTYRGIMSSSLALVEGAEYVGQIDATGSGGEIGHFEVPFRAVVREGVC